MRGDKCIWIILLSFVFIFGGCLTVLRLPQLQQRNSLVPQVEEHTKGQRGVSTAVYGIVKRSEVFLPNERMNQDLCFLPWQFAQ